jgi:lambda family phage tail tape measure protein
MADLSYNVKVNTADAQRSLNGLKSALGGLAAAFSIRAVVRFADGVANLQNKLRTVSKDTKDVERQFAAIVAIANSSRSSLDAVGDLYFKIARAAQDLGVSQRDAATITDTVAKALQLSGASASEASSAITQLGQALGSGLLRGEELNAILENAPVLATMLAKELGVTVGQLRKLGSEGKLTGDLVAQAFIRANVAVNDQFGKTLPTISQSFTKLQTSISVIFAQLEKDTGVFAKLANAIISVAQSLATFATFLSNNGEAIMALVKITGTLLAAYLAVHKGVKIVQAAQTALIATFGLMAGKTSLMVGIFGGAAVAARNFGKALGVMAAGPAKLTKVGYAIAGIGAAMRVLLRFAGVVGLFLAIAQAVDYLIKRFTGFSIIDEVIDKFKALAKWMNWFSEETKNTDTALQDSLGALKTDTTATEANSEAKKKAAKDAADLAKKIRDLRAELVRAAQDYGNQANELERSLSIQNKLIGASQLKKDLDAAARQAESAYFSEAQRLQDALASAKRSANEEERAQIPLLLEQLAKLDRRYADNLDTIKRLVVEQEDLNRARNMEVFALEAQERVTDQLSRIQNESARVGLTNIQKKYLDIRDAADESAKAAIRAEEARRGESLNAAEVEAYYSAARRGIDNVYAAQRRLNEQSRSFSTGWRQAFNDYVDSATDASKQAARLFEKFTSGIEDALVDFTKTGKLNWKKFVADMSEELLRSQIRKTIAGLGQKFGLGDLFGGSTPGSSPSNPMYAAIVGGGGGVGGALAGVMGGGKSGEPSLLSKIGSSISGLFGGGKDASGKEKPSLLSRAGSAISGLFGGSKPPGGVGPTQPSILQRAGSAISGLFGGSKPGQPSLLSRAGSAISGLFSSGKSKGGGILDSVVKGAKSLFGGFFANGGTLPRGKFGVVGERGPELISGPGQITPLQGMGGSTNVTYNIQAVDAASFQALVARDPSFIHAVAMQGARGIPARR